MVLVAPAVLVVLGVLVALVVLLVLLVLHHVGQTWEQHNKAKRKSRARVPWFVFIAVLKENQ